MNQIIFDVKNKITIIRENGTYPHTNNCYDVKVTGPNKLDIDIRFLPKAEYDLAMLLRSFSKILRPDEIKKFISAAEKYGDHRYQEAQKI